MKFGVREICNVVLKAKGVQHVGSKKFYKDEPVLYFDSLKTSTMEGAATTVYAQGGRGNSRLIAWEGERTVTFTMEDALISPEGLAILTGADLIEAGGVKTYTENDLAVTKGTGSVTIALSKAPATTANLTISISDGFGNYTYTSKDDKVAVADKTITITDSDLVNVTDDNTKANVTVFDVTSAQTINVHTTERTDKVVKSEGKVEITVSQAPVNDENAIYVMALNDRGDIVSEPYCAGVYATDKVITIPSTNNDIDKIGDVVFVDYYVAKTTGAMQIDITPDKFGGNYYLEADTLFRDESGQDLPAEFIIPNCKVQSNFTFTMASSGDPSTFTFTMDAFPDYTRWNKTKKVLSAIQVITEIDGEDFDAVRARTAHVDRD